MADLDQEKKLVKNAQKDPEAFGIIFDKYYDRIFGYVLRRVANPDIAKDIISEVFFKAFTNLWKFRWRNISISAWLYKIATNEVNYFFRKKKYKTVSLDRLMEENGLEPVSPEATIEEELINVEITLKKHQDYLEVQKRIAEMPVKYQEVISLRIFESKSIKEISEILNKKEGTIKSLLSRGIHNLK
ncbi:sigma-70 family RNA polymerase sigma factor [candidate division KSB1 bacterium]|nr:sigma-70 family RNA polymerase sigma factor [candidate division KSB1 bacterium]